MKWNYKSFQVGGDPEKIDFLGNRLGDKLQELQENGWVIDGVDLINDDEAWHIRRQQFVTTQYYIIRAKKQM